MQYSQLLIGIIIVIVIQIFVIQPLIVAQLIFIFVLAAVKQTLVLRTHFSHNLFPPFFYCNDIILNILSIVKRLSMLKFNR